MSLASTIYHSKRTVLPGIVLAMALWATATQAQVYEWVDKNGVKHFSDKAPHAEQARKKKTSEVIEAFKGVSYSPSRVTSSEISNIHRVILLSTSWSEASQTARDYFQSEGIRYTEIDVEESEDGLELYHRLETEGVPIIIVGTTKMNGFSVDGFKRIYP